MTTKFSRRLAAGLTRLYQHIQHLCGGSVTCNIHVTWFTELVTELDRWRSNSVSPSLPIDNMCTNSFDPELWLSHNDDDDDDVKFKVRMCA